MIIASTQLLWYTTRATGVVALVLLTASVALGVLTSVRFGTSLWPRFAWQDLHKRISLLSMLFVGLHVVTAVTDSFAPIGWLSVFVPFTSSYRRLWLGLGTAAVDLLLAITISSLLRHRIDQRVWRWLHWLSYASWPLALVHGLGTGTDPHLSWMILLTVACVGVVLAAVGWRLVAGWPAKAATRLAAGAGSLVGVLVLALWTFSGPLRPGWAARAGTPSSLLAGAQHTATATPATTPPAGSSGTGSPAGSSTGTNTSGSTSLPSPPYDAPLAGSVAQTSTSGGLEQVDLKAQTQGTLHAALEVVILGRPDPSSGGVVMQQSSATFGPPGAPGQYQGSISGLEGQRILLALHNQAGGTLALRLDVSFSGNQLSGRLASVNAGSEGGGGDDY